MSQLMYLISGALFVLCVFEAVAILALFRQIGNILVILDRVPKLAPTPEGVVLAGSPVPPVAVRLSSGESAELPDLTRGGALIILVQENCSACTEALHHLENLVDQYQKRLRVLIVVNDSEEGSRRFIGSRPFPFSLIADADGHVSAAFHNPTPPYAFTADSEAVIRAQGRVSSKKHLEHILSPLVDIDGHPSATGGDDRLADSVGLNGNV